RWSPTALLVVLSGVSSLSITGAELAAVMVQFDTLDESAPRPCDNWEIRWPSAFACAATGPSPSRPMAERTLARLLTTAPGGPEIAAPARSADLLPNGDSCGPCPPLPK